MKRILKIVTVIVVLLVAGFVVTVVSLPNSKLHPLIAGLPVVSIYQAPIVTMTDAVRDGVEDAIYNVKSLYRDIAELINFSPTAKVVIELEPVSRQPRSPTPDAPSQIVSETATAQSIAALGLEVAEVSDGELPTHREPAIGEPVMQQPVTATESVSETAPPATPSAPTMEPESTPPPTLQPTAPAVLKVDADANYKRGLFYYKGVGTAKDYKTAARWFKRAADNGHPVAQYNLGIMSYLGQGMTQDFTGAVKWFRLAGEQSHAPAQYNLGFLYYEGKGVEKDTLQAYMWIDRAANLGDKKAAHARDTLKKALPPEIFAEEKKQN